MGVTLRPVTEADRAAIAAMLAGCGAFSPNEIAVALEMVDAGLGGEYTLLVAESAGCVVGYACFGQAPLTASTWYLYWICVALEAQRAGLGRTLQAGVEAAIVTAGGRRLVLETSGRPDYAKARDFYGRAGFVAVGRIPDFYDQGDDCLIYCKALAGGSMDER
jgi:ribosomal protein S18 acetylase RimI-like enzyme